MKGSALASLIKCEYFDVSGGVGQTYWYWVEAVGATDTTECKQPVSGMKQKPIVISAITYANLHGATHANPATYQEGAVVAFTPPSGRTGYTFTGWTPAAITVDMMGAQTVTAGWRANAYQIAYYANGGSGTMTATDCEYDKEGEIAANGFTRSGYVFKGWATEENGEVVYQPGAKVANLTGNDSGVVKLYAVWEAESIAMPMVDPPDGTVFKSESCTVSITCETEDASVYYRVGAAAKVKIVSGDADITEFLDVPVADGNGVVDLTKATVKEEIVKEALDVEKGAVIDLSGGSQGTASPTITTAPTRVGLFYSFREGTTLEGFSTKAPSATKKGDGTKWSPAITVKGGDSGFYAIGVGKGE